MKNSKYWEVQLKIKLQKYLERIRQNSETITSKFCNNVSEFWDIEVKILRQKSKFCNK